MASDKKTIEKTMPKDFSDPISILSTMIFRNK